MAFDDATLIEYVLETLDEAGRQSVDGALIADASLRQRLSAVTESLGDIGVSGPMKPPPSLRESVLGTVSRDFSGFCSRIARLFGLSDARACEYMAKLDNAPEAPWLSTPFPGIYALPVPDAQCAGSAHFFYLAAGHNVPRHRHRGQETMFVIDGYAKEDSGRELSPGDLVYSDSSVEHDFTIHKQAACLFAVTLDGELEYVSR